MCGIFGWIPSARRRRQPIRPVAEALVRALRRRGPDDRGYVAFDGAGRRFSETGDAQPEECVLLLGQTRLSIIDLSAGGHQPMSTPDGRYTLVFNGEIYNYRELRRVLEGEGIAFSTESDTEVLLQWLVSRGSAGMAALNGMFAFVLYDAGTRRLLCARDYFGIKPFFYYCGGGDFGFASELPALLEFSFVPRRVSPQAAYSYLCFSQYDWGGETFIRGVRQLPPGHWVEVGLDRTEDAVPQCFWRPDLNRRSDLTFAEAAARTREIFLDNVRLHLRSDVPLGIALSGGIDSSAIACAVRHLEPEMEIHTFSFVARGSAVSEEDWIRRVAVHVGAVSHLVELEPAELAAELDPMIRSQGEPFASTSIYAQRRVFQLARECGVTVTLDGQGADELFGGYYGYPGPRLASLLLHGNALGALRFFRATTSWPGRVPSAVLRGMLREFTPDRLNALGMRLAGRNPAPSWLDLDALREAGTRLGLRDERASFYPCRDRMRQMLAYQLTWHGLPHLLRHGDRNSMAFSIESRVPFLTREMAEFSLSLPEEYLVDASGLSKAVLRAAMRGIVPDEVLDRRDKIGFATPEKEWLFSLSDWVDQTLRRAEAVPYVSTESMRREWAAVRDGSAPFDWRIWRWLNYVRWVELFRIEM